MRVMGIPYSSSDENQWSHRAAFTPGHSASESRRNATACPEPGRLKAALIIRVSVR